MPISIVGTGSITGLSAGGLPDGSITAADLASGAARSNFGAGAVLQVVQSTKTDTASFTSSTYSSSGLSVSITPTNSNNKILLLAQVNVSWDAALAKSAVSLFRDSTKIHFGDARGSRGRDSNYFYLDGNSYSPLPMPILFLDSPATTNQIVYSVQIRNMDAVGVIYINRSTDVDTDSSIFGTTASSLVCMEIAG